MIFALRVLGSSAVKKISSGLAVVAAQVAAVRDRNAQAAQRPAQPVVQRRLQWQLSRAMRPRFRGPMLGCSRELPNLSEVVTSCSERDMVLVVRDLRLAARANRHPEFQKRWRRGPPATRWLIVPHS